MRLYYTAVNGAEVAQPVPQLSLGGFKSSSPLTNSQFGNLFGDITPVSISNFNQNQYIGLILKNETGADVTGVKFWFGLPEGCYTKLKIAAVDLTDDGQMEHIPNMSSKPLNADFVEATEDGVNSVKAGYIYNEYALEGIAPAGWHVPSKVEFETMVTTLGGFSAASSKLKEAGSNETGFSMKLSGVRGVDGFAGKDLFGELWASTLAVEGENFTMSFVVMNEFTSIQQLSFEKGCYIRLIKDNSVNTGTMTDRDGNVYTTVKIGNQVWMAQSLAVTKLADGTEIPNVTDETEWAALTTKGYCAYDNDISYAIEENINSADLGDLTNEEQIGIWIERELLLDVIETQQATIYAKDPMLENRFIEIILNKLDEISIFLSWD